MIVFSILGIGLLGLMVFGFIKLSRKRPQKHFPSQWKPVLEKEVLFYRKLDEKDKVIFQNRMMAFLAEINVEAVQFELTDKDRMLVSASAVIPIFNFGDWVYDNLETVLIYPGHFNEDLGFNKDDPKRRIAGMVGTGQFENQMILSRKALYHGFSNATDKGNTAVHEFVHLLDKLDGDTDGIPERLLEHRYIEPWLSLMHREMERINNDESDIRKYGATNQAEFFAVASEYFFERPDLFKRKHPELYEMLVNCFERPKSKN
ncbi:zinc-dependent peptidase [Dokdonia sinensis]|uniref:Zinc-dependent peptidase n=1 Tax=Dokdonia sinensis TaxID=2479847 RepID=A0A3M0GMI7_9FLAO|nr:M90 family metallopeptidase [Dokdonia sinensis]RMB62843.1 zinc-dependent peptidase [Dokdonia sinensis]